MSFASQLEHWAARERAIAGERPREVEPPAPEPPVPARQPEARAPDHRALIEKWSPAARAGYLGDALIELSRFMEAHNIADVVRGMAAFERAHPPAEPVTGSGRRWPAEPDMSRVVANALDRFIATGDDETFLSITVPLAQTEGRGGQ